MGGDFYRPHILKEAYDFGLKESQQKYESQKRFSVTLKDDTKRIVKEGMAQTNTEGSGRMLKELPFASAGKTGTSQTGAERNNAWFVSYAPLDNPQIAILVLFEEGNDPYQTAVPATKKILEWYYTNRGFGN
jgi:cell division protein FtsI/penicillin-binding protein 2